MLTKTKNFLDEVRVELEKVTWPTRKETVATAWVVVIIIVLLSFFLGACDLVLGKLIQLVLR